MQGTNADAGHLGKRADAQPAHADTHRSADAGASRLSVWFAVAGVLLLATVLAATFVQARQYAMLNLTVQSQDDYLALSLYQLETEYLRLREVMRPVNGELPPRATVQLRYDIFVSRLALLKTERAQRMLAQSGVSAQALGDLARFTQRADLYLGPEPRGVLSPPVAQALLDELLTLDRPIHRMLLDATQHVAVQITERGQQMRDHNSVGLGLTVFLVAMVLAFAGLALRQMRLVEQRRVRQQALADQLREARIEAEAASEAKSDFLADMSHELRTPLHGLLGMLSLVRESPRDARAPSWLATADESAHHLLKLLDDMLDLSKLEAGTLTLSPQPVHLGNLVQDVMAWLQPAATAKGLALQSTLSPELPTHVLLDPTRVKQVLINLLSNAVKFSDSGAVALRVHALRDDGQPERLGFDVADTGIGMDSDTVSRLFQRYTRADDPRARGQGGTGLGLAISRNLASLMQGEIQVRSRPGAGSVFGFSCPLLAAEPAPAAEPGAQGTGTGPLRVLVAEDHPVNQLYMATLLQRLGHQTLLADNGLEALKLAKSEPLDLVLMDVHMPVMDGVAACQAIRSLPGPTGQVCIVALTADVFADTRNRCLAAGAVEVATKPMNLATLQALLESHFGRGRAHAPAGSPHGPVADQAPAVETARLLDTAAVRGVRELMGDAGQAPTLYAAFFAQATAAAQTMREAMRADEPEALARAAHSVKGAALNLGLPALAEAADQLNRQVRQLTPAELALAVQRFEELATATQRLCESEGLVSTLP